MQVLANILSSIKGVEEQVVKKMSAILLAVIGMSCAVTVRSIARVSGIKERTLHRFYNTSLDWNKIRWDMFEEHFRKTVGTVFLFIIDEVVEDKDGDCTAGQGYFYSGLLSRVVKGVSFLVVTMVDVNTSQSYVLGVGQLLMTAADKLRLAKLKSDKLDLANRKAAAAERGEAFVRRPSGRRKGTTKEVLAQRKEEGKDAHESMVFRTAKRILTQLAGFFKGSNAKIPKYLLGDGGFGNSYYVGLCAEIGCFLISKMKHNAVLFLPYQGKHDPHKKGTKRKYGTKVAYNNLPKDYLVETKKTATLLIHTYCFKAYNKALSDNLLNLVLIEKTDLTTGVKSKVILFSTDLDLGSEDLIKYYQYRNEIELDFRECKQFFGLRDFKNTAPQKVTTAVNLTFTAHLAAQLLAIKVREELGCEKLSILDVVCYCKAELYARQLLKLNLFGAFSILSSQQIAEVAQLEAINLRMTA